MAFHPPIWDEPVRGGYPDLGMLSLPGIERMRANPEVGFPRPPIHHLFGLVPTDATETSSTFAMPASEWLQTSAGVYFAGTTALVADAPFGGAILAGVPAGVVGTTSELSMNFLRPADPSSKELVAKAEVIDVGRRLGLSQATVVDAHGRLLAHGTSRYVLMHLDNLPPPTKIGPVESPDYETPDPWQRPVEGAVFPPEMCRDTPWLELFRASMNGELPPAPFSLLFGTGISHAAEGEFAVQTKATEWLCSPARTIYGGIIAFIADNAMMGAVYTTLPTGSAAATLDLKVNYLRPGFADGRMLTTRATVVHRGKRIAVTRAEMVNEDGKQIAIATGSTMIIDRWAWDPTTPIVVADEAASED